MTCLRASRGYSRSLLGDVGSQLRVLSALRRGSIIYAAQAHEVTGLALARRQGLLRAPIVGVFHGVRWRLPLHRASLPGFDRAIAMSKLTAQALIRENYPADRISVLNWGPDLEFTEFSPEAPRSSEGGVVATGKTARDWRTLIEALARTGARARIYAGESVSACRLPDNVEVVPSVALRPSPEAPYTYGHTVHDLRSAAVVAIPLVDPYPLQGLTELADAIACARPVIVTRAPYFDLDVEAIGCGWWVDEGDVEGWTATIEQALADRARLREMGQAGRRWAERNWNARIFADGVERVLADVARSIAGSN